MKKTFLLTILALLTLSSCNNGQYIGLDEKDISSKEEIDDKYRNYYEIFVASYYDSNNDGIGDLKGVEEKLDYIKSLNYSGIWLMPIFTSPSYHKYNVTNYYEIDPSYGSLNDLKSLIDSAHEKGINIILDLTVNHSSRSCDYFSKFLNAYYKKVKGLALSEEEELYSSFYSYNATSCPNGYSLATINDVSLYVESNFDSDMVEFNLDNQLARETIFNIAEYYLKLGIDGFRLDAVKYCYIDNISKNIEFLSEFQNRCSAINSNAYVVGECWDSETIINDYYGSDLDSYFYFPGSGNNGIIGSTLMDGSFCNKYLNLSKNLIKNAKGKIPAPFLDNHDMSRYSRIDRNFDKFAYGLLSMLNGTTFTYYGDEIGLNGTVKPDQNVRKHMKWSNESSYEGLCNDPEGADTFDYNHDGVLEQTSDKNSILNYYKTANLIRKKYSAIPRGEILETSMSDSESKFVVINKKYSEEEISIIFNFSSKDELVYNLNNTEYRNFANSLIIDSEVKCKLNKSNNTIIIPPFGIVVLTK